MKKFNCFILLCVTFFTTISPRIVSRNLRNRPTTYDSSNCGISYGRINTPLCSETSQSIVGGADASKGTWPWQVAIFEKGYNLCGGSLIHPQYVLTAAHCTAKINPKKLYVYGGITGLLEIDDESNPPWGSHIEKIIEHKDYENIDYDNDICLIKLSNPAPLSRNLNTICLPDDSDSVKRGEDCYATGWGFTYNETKDDAENLQELCLPIIGRYKKCVEYDPQMNRKNICAGYAQGGASICDGDSGGPLVCKRGKAYKLFGIVSTGGDDNGTCAVQDTPDYFIDVKKYMPWIRRHVPDL